MDEKAIKLKKKTVAELPDEIIGEEIVTRLPVKYAVRFKCVSKYWLSLLSGPQFVKQHLTHNSTQNPNYHDCVIIKKYNKIFILTHYKETYLLPARNYQLVGSINGLVCIRSDTKLSLWNPAIHQSKEVTPPPSREHVCTTFPTGREHAYNIGLGYDPANNNYKVVVFSVDRRSASVYNSISDSWIDVVVADNVFSKNALEKSTPTTIVNNCPYWTCSSLSPDKTFILSLAVVMFDAASNEFKLLPEFYCDLFATREKRGLGYKFVDMKDSLTLLVLDKSNTDCMVDIYSLCGEEGCCVWIKMASAGPVDFHMRHHFVSVLQGFKDGDEILFSEDGFISCYDYNKASGPISRYDKETGVIRRLHGSKFTCDDGKFSCFRYTPTLSFIQGMKSVHPTTQARTSRCYRTPRRLISSLR